MLLSQERGEPGRSAARRATRRDLTGRLTDGAAWQQRTPSGSQRRRQCSRGRAVNWRQRLVRGRAWPVERRRKELWKAAVRLRSARRAGGYLPLPSFNHPFPPSSSVDENNLRDQRSRLAPPARSALRRDCQISRLCALRFDQTHSREPIALVEKARGPELCGRAATGAGHGRRHSQQQPRPALGQLVATARPASGATKARPAETKPMPDEAVKTPSRGMRMIMTVSGVSIGNSLGADPSVELSAALAGPKVTRALHTKSRAKSRRN